MSATITENEKRRTEKLRIVSTESCFLPHFDVVVFVPILTPRLQKVSREEGNKIGMKNKAQLCSWAEQSVISIRTLLTSQAWPLWLPLIEVQHHRWWCQSLAPPGSGLYRKMHIVLCGTHFTWGRPSLGADIRISSHKVNIRVGTTLTQTECLPSSTSYKSTWPALRIGRPSSSLSPGLGTRAQGIAVQLAKQETWPHHQHPDWVCGPSTTKNEDWIQIQISSGQLVEQSCSIF